MFSIQYEAVDGSQKMQDLDSKSRTILVRHLAAFNRPIVAVYEQSTVITKTMRKDLAEWPGAKTRYAVAFATAMTPA